MGVLLVSPLYSPYFISETFSLMPHVDIDQKPKHVNLCVTCVIVFLFFLFCINPLLFGYIQQIDIYAFAILNKLLLQLQFLLQTSRRPTYCA